MVLVVSPIGEVLLIFVDVALCFVDTLYNPACIS